METIGTAAPPSYVDLGKLARDLFSKGYHFGLWKLGCKSKTESGLEFNTSGQSNQDSGKVFGSVETKYKFKEHGISLTERWSTDNTLFTEVSVQDKLAEGLKLAVEATFSPPSGDKDGKIKVAYGQEKFKLDFDTNIDLEGPLINASAVLGHEGWLAGYKTEFNTQDSTFTKHNFALGYTAADFTLHASFDNGDVITGSLFHRTTEKLDTAIEVSCTSGGDDLHLKAACKYQLDADAAIRAKLNEEGLIGLGYQQNLRKGITLSLCTLINSKDISAGGVKLGLALELEA